MGFVRSTVVCLIFPGPSPIELTQPAHPHDPLQAQVRFSPPPKEMVVSSPIPLSPLLQRPPSPPAPRNPFAVLRSTIPAYAVLTFTILCPYEIKLVTMRASLPLSPRCRLPSGRRALFSPPSMNEIFFLSSGFSGTIFPQLIEHSLIGRMLETNQFLMGAENSILNDSPVTRLALAPPS